MSVRPPPASILKVKGGGRRERGEGEMETDQAKEGEGGRSEPRRIRYRKYYTMMSLCVMS